MIIYSEGQDNSVIGADTGNHTQRTEKSISRIPAMCSQETSQTSVACGGIQEKCKVFTRYRNLNKILTFGCYHYYDHGVESAHDFAETRLLFPIVTPSEFPASLSVSLCPRAALAGNRGNWPSNSKNLGYKACEMSKPKSSNLDPKGGE